MGSFKNSLREGLAEVKETSEQTKEVGNEMTDDSEEIKGILEGITLNDDEDVEGVSDTKAQYQKADGYTYVYVHEK